MNAASDFFVDAPKDIPPHVPLVFFYSGPELPDYCFNALRHALAVWGQKVVLLCDVDAPKVPPGVLVVNFKHWFKPQALEETIARNKIDPNFRSGFWLATLKRFFVLNQYLEMTKSDTAVHVELDSIIFVSSEELFCRELPNPGLLVPWNPPQLAVGSFVIVNGRSSLERFVRFAATGRGFSNEMELLTSFLLETTEPGYGLPTIDELMYPPLITSSAKNLLSEKQVGMRFDAARFGQWVFGIDPRNTRGAFSTNHFVEPGLKQVKAHHDRRSGFPVIRSINRATPSRLANIHVHSKRVFQATNSTQRAIWFALANLPFTSVVGINTLKMRKLCSRVIGQSRLRILQEVRRLLRTVSR